MDKMKKILFSVTFFLVLFSCAKNSSVTIKEENTSFFESPFEDIQILYLTPSIKKGGSGFILVKSNIPLEISNIFILVNESYKCPFYNYNSEKKLLSFFGWPVYQNDLRLSVVYRKGENWITNKLEIKKSYIDYGKVKIALSDKFGIEKLEEFNIAKLPADPLKRYEFILKELSAKKSFDAIKYITENRSKFNVFKFYPYNSFKDCKVSSPYGLKRDFYLKNKNVRSSYHLGVDFVNGKNFSIYSIADGIVVFSGYNGGNGNYILIDHGAGIYSSYSHCSKLLVKEGNYVKKGELIAFSGSSGYVTGDHLHFSIIINGIYVDPSEWLDENWVKGNLSPVFDFAPLGDD